MTVRSTPIRTVDGRELPLPGTWNADPSHSEIQFVVHHMMIAKVRGRFRGFTCTVQIAPNPADSSVETVIDAASIDTGDPTRDEHLRSVDFLDVEHHPHITFRSTSVRLTDEGRWEVLGDLTVLDAAVPTSLALDYLGSTIDPWSGTRTAFEASTEIDREAFGLTWNKALETGGFLVGRRVRVELDIEAVLVDPS